jgi:hypothetical protein
MISYMKLLTFENEVSMYGIVKVFRLFVVKVLRIELLEVLRIFRVSIAIN